MPVDADELLQRLLTVARGLQAQLHQYECRGQHLPWVIKRARDEAARLMSAAEDTFPLKGFYCDACAAQHEAKPECVCGGRGWTAKDMTAGHGPSEFCTWSELNMAAARWRREGI